MVCLTKISFNENLSIPSEGIFICMPNLNLILHFEFAYFDFLIFFFALFFCKHKNSVLSIQPTTPPPPRPPPPEIQKTPPRWPLRPGVLVHVKVDTKQNLCASRAQSPLTPENSIKSPVQSVGTESTNVSYASPLLPAAATSQSNAAIETNGSKSNLSSPPILPARNPLRMSATGVQPDSDILLASEQVNVEEMNTSNPTAANSTSTQTTSTTATTTSSTATNNNNNDELATFTSSSLIEKILNRLRWRREQTKNYENNNNSKKESGDGRNISPTSKSNKRAVTLLRGTGWFGSGKSTNSKTGLFDTFLDGITYDDGGK